MKIQIAGPMGAAALVAAGLCAFALSTAPARAHHRVAGQDDMPEQCRASIAAFSADLAIMRSPPRTADTVTVLRHIMFVSQEMMSVLDGSCGDWGGRQAMFGQFSNEYQAAHKTCTQIATNPDAVCYSKRYGS